MKALLKYILHNITARWLKKRDTIVCCAKIWSLRGRTSILLKIGENCERLGNIWQVFSNVGRTYFTLSVDRFLTSTTNKKNQMRPGLKTSVFFLFLFFFLCFVLFFFFPQICIKGRKKVSSGKDSSPQKLYRHMFLENVLSALFTFTQHSFVQYVWYSHSPLVKTHHVKEYSPALNRTQVSEIRHLCPKSGSRV